MLRSGYLDAVIGRTEHIRLLGIGSGGGAKTARHLQPIENLYTRLFARSDARTRTDDAAPLRLHRSIDLATLLPQHDRLLIEGQPGAGKTTFVQLVACMLARDARGVPCPGQSSWRNKHLGIPDDEPPRIPILLRIAELVPLLLQDQKRDDNRLWLLDLIEEYCKGNAIAADRNTWQTLLESGDATVLLDGLDEVADEELRQRVFRVFDDACRTWGDCPFVVTSRPIQTEHLRKTHEFGFATIEPFDRERVRAFLDQFADALHDIPPGTTRTDQATAYVGELRHAILTRSPILRLAQNPVMLTCLCVVHWNDGRLPDGRARVYKTVVDWLLRQKAERRNQLGYTNRFALRAFAKLALTMMQGKAGKRSVFDLHDAACAIEDVVQRFFPDLESSSDRQAHARAWLRYECLGSGIVEEIAANKLRFWHLTFQEYLAAYQLALGTDAPDSDEAWWPTVKSHLEDAQWRETIDIFPGCLFDEGGEVRVDTLLKQVIELEPNADESELAHDARRAGIIGRLLQPLSVYDYQAKSEVQSEYDAALERAMRMFTLEGAAEVPWQQRIAAAEALGRAGDPRLAPEKFDENLIPVPDLDGLRIGKYAVTVEEYQRFVEDRGYEREEVWGEDGWSKLQEESWTEPGSWTEQLANPSRPVVKVSWFEARAYCRWLSDLRQVDVRLPTFDQHSTASTSPEGEYPWGAAEPDEELANFNQNVGAATPVGIYPRDASPLGHMDFGGNVWEWCSDLEDGKWPRLRGGGWNSDAQYLRSATRVRDDPDFRSDGGIGFRVAVTPPSTLSP